MKASHGAMWISWNVVHITFIIIGWRSFPEILRHLSSVSVWLIDLTMVGSIFDFSNVIFLICWQILSPPICPPPHVISPQLTSRIDIIPLENRSEVCSKSFSSRIKKIVEVLVSCNGWAEILWKPRLLRRVSLLLFLQQHPRYEILHLGVTWQTSMNQDTNPCYWFPSSQQTKDGGATVCQPERTFHPFYTTLPVDNKIPSQPSVCLLNHARSPEPRDVFSASEAKVSSVITNDQAIHFSCIQQDDTGKESSSNRLGRAHFVNMASPRLINERRSSIIEIELWWSN